MLAAQAIMTTDTKPKLAVRRVGEASLLGLAKGAAMIHPNMATMLAVVVTDAAVEPAALHAMLRRAVDRSFNAISVDGDTSTNDTVLVLANGLAGPVDAGRVRERADRGLHRPGAADRARRRGRQQVRHRAGQRARPARPTPARWPRPSPPRCWSRPRSTAAIPTGAGCWPRPAAAASSWTRAALRSGSPATAARSTLW